MHRSPAGKFSLTRARVHGEGSPVGQAQDLVGAAGLNSGSSGPKSHMGLEPWTREALGPRQIGTASNNRWGGCERVHTEGDTNRLRPLRVSVQACSFKKKK